MSVTPSAMRRLMREINELKTSPPEGIRIVANEDNMLDVTGITEGPEGTPYAGGYFRVRFKFTEDFPSSPPKCWFATKIFHPNVSSSGEICVNTLKKDWVSTYGIAHILVTVKCLLIYPNPESALDEEAGKLLLEDYEMYCERARLITSVHATPKVRPVEFDTPVSEATKPSKKLQTASGSTKAALPSFPPLLPSVGDAPVMAKPTSPQPLQSTASNTPSVPPPSSALKEKERHTSPTPLSTADANVDSVKASATVVGGGNKAVKRSATGAGGTGIEKRKKALKRL